MLERNYVKDVGILFAHPSAGQSGLEYGMMGFTNELDLTWSSEAKINYTHKGNGTHLQNSIRQS